MNIKVFLWLYLKAFIFYNSLLRGDKMDFELLISTMNKSLDEIKKNDFRYEYSL